MSDTQVMDSSAAPADAAAINWWGMLTDPDYLRNPYPDLKRIRELAPVHYDPGSNVYFVLGHEEFHVMARAPEMGRDTKLWVQGWSSPQNRERDPVSYELFSEFHRQMVNANPPDHRRMRDVFEKALRPSQVAQYLRVVEVECRRLLDALPVDTPFDFMTAFANHLPLSVSRNLFDMPMAMDQQLGQWSAALLKIGDILMTPQQKQAALVALREFKDYLKLHLASWQGDTESSFMGMALQAQAKGVLDEEETLNNLLGLISGNESTITLLGNGLLSLLRHPVQMRRLREQPDLMRSAIEEMLRYEPGINFIIRVAIDEFHCGGLHMPAGSLAIGLVGAFNRDPTRFENPDDFDISRKPNSHAIFGGGPHVCIGAALARLEAQVAFTALLERFPHIELVGEPVWWVDRTNQRGLQSLPVRLVREA